MRSLFLLLFPFLLSAQTKDLSVLNSLEENEQITIDIKIGGCFDGTTNTKIIITKKDTFFELVYIENIYQIIAKIDKNLLLYSEKLEKWILENTETLLKYGKVKIITEAQYSSKINSIETTIKTFKDCVSRFVGEYSIIKITSKQLQFEQKYDCKIKLKL